MLGLELYLHFHLTILRMICEKWQMKMDGNLFQMGLIQILLFHTSRMILVKFFLELYLMKIEKQPKNFFQIQKDF